MPAALRLASASDIDQLVALENIAFPGDRLSRASLRRLLGAPSAVLLVAECGGRIAGYALALFRSGSGVARLYGIAVHPDFAGAGLGGALLAAVETKAEGRECAALRLEVRADNVAARRLYERAGYRSIGEVAGYYEDGATALRLEKTLAEPGRATRASRPGPLGPVEERLR